MVKEVTSKEEFDSLLADAGDKLVVVDFTASWCGPCQRIAPEFQRLSEMKPNVVFLKVDVDKCSSIAKEYKVPAMPAFKFIKKNQLFDTVFGANIEAVAGLTARYSAPDAVPHENPEGSYQPSYCQIS